MQVFIDESGNLGKNGRFFVIAALIPENPKRIKNIVKRSCVKFGFAKTTFDEIKASQLSFPEKQEIIFKLREKDDFSCSYIVADKNFLHPKIFADKNLCYNYLSSFLLKQIIKRATEDIEVILDNHTIKVYSAYSLKDYIRISAYSKWGFEKDISFKYLDSKECKALQAIDVLANAVYAKYNYDKKHLYGLIEPNFKYRIKFPYDKFGL